MPGEKVLIVEDEKNLSKLLRYNFEKEGYRVSVAADGSAALAAARKDKPDLVILDIMLPGLDGLEVCRLLRQESAVPIVFLTAKKTETDRILGLKLGADDYVTKPFSVGELLARAQAVLRRTGPGRRAGERRQARAGELVVDFDQHTVRVRGAAVALTPKEFELLKLLFDAAGKVLSRDDILERLWGYDKSMEIDTRTVDQHVFRLRKKLLSEGERIVTVMNAGYRVEFD